MGWGRRMIDNLNKLELSLNDSNNDINNLIYVFSKRVKDKDYRKKKITTFKEKEKLESIIGKLMEHGREQDIKDLELDENPNRWLLGIFDNYNKDNEKLTEQFEYLLNDFTAHLKTRRREYDRYAVGIISKNYILLANTVFGEETITPTYEIIPRMMDKDNIMLYALFRMEKDESVKVRYYEFYKSDFFVEWLGIYEKDSHYYQGGKYRIYTDIIGNSTVLELNDENIEKIRGSINGNQITLDVPIDVITIEQVRIGKKRYPDFEVFYKHFIDDQYNLKYYKNKFFEIIGNLDVQISRYSDCREGVEKYEEGLVIKKRNPHFNILFGANKGNGDIEFSPDYINELYSYYSNGNHFQVFHAGDKLASKPVEIQKMAVHNELCDDISKFLIDYINETGLRDRDLFNILSFTTFKILAIENQEKYIHYFLNLMGLKSLTMLKNNKFTDNENEILEFKSSGYFDGSPEDIADRLILDLRKKLSSNHFKVYLIGVTEPPAGKLDPIKKQSMKSDDITKIERIINREKYIEKVDIFQMLVNEDEGIVVMTVLGEKVDESSMFNLMKY